MRLVLHPVTGTFENVEGRAGAELLKLGAPLGQMGRGGGVEFAPDAREAARHAGQTVAEGAGVRDVLAAHARLAGVPALAIERKVVDVALDGLRREVQPVLDPAQLAQMKQTADSIYLDDKVKDYVLDIVSATRHPERYRLDDLKPLIQYGASPRASINLCLAARAHAFLVGRAYVTPDDVKRAALPALRHRIAAAPELEIEGRGSDSLVTALLEQVPAPRQ